MYIYIHLHIPKQGHFKVVYIDNVSLLEQLVKDDLFRDCIMY